MVVSKLLYIQLWGHPVNEDHPSINSALQDYDSKKRSRGISAKDARTTKYRKRKEAGRIDPKQTLFNFGYTSTPKEEVEVESKKEPHTKKELMYINNAYESIL